MPDSSRSALVDASGRPLDASVDYLIVFLESTLVAVPYDRKRLRVTGQAIPLGEGHPRGDAA